VMQTNLESVLLAQEHQLQVRLLGPVKQDL
jgi:hypothetical protein